MTFFGRIRTRPKSSVPTGPESGSATAATLLPSPLKFLFASSKNYDFEPSCFCQWKRLVVLEILLPILFQAIWQCEHRVPHP